MTLDNVNDRINALCTNKHICPGFERGALICVLAREKHLFSLEKEYFVEFNFEC